jgi:hypothetical protein
MTLIIASRLFTSSPSAPACCTFYVIAKTLKAFEALKKVKWFEAIPTLPGSNEIASLQHALPALRLAMT